MKPDDLARLRIPADPRLHPDGIRIAFVVSRPDLDEDRYVRRIWLWDGDESRAFTQGPGDSTPRWSPDGTRLAFLRTGTDDGDRPQVAVMHADGGEARVLTDVALGVEDLAWSPDGTRLAVVGVDWVEDLADLDDDERERRPRRVTRAAWRRDNEGWRHDRRRHLYLLDAGGGDEAGARLATPGDFDDTCPRWRPDGAALAFLSARHDDHDLDFGNQPFLLHLEGDDPGRIEAAADVGIWCDVSWRPDGILHLGGMPDRWGWPGVNGIWRVEDDGLVEVTRNLGRDVYPLAPAVSPRGPQWVEDRFLVTVEDRGATRVAAVAPDGASEEVIGGRRCVTGVSPREDGNAFAFVATDPLDPGEVHWWEDGTERTLTALNDGFRDDVPLATPAAFTFESEDGVEVDAWAYLPGGDDDVPLLLNIHGGPASQYGWYFFDEFQVYARAGYGVVATNPRGSSGRGQDWVRAVVGTWPDENPPDLVDLEAGIAAALSRFPRLDPERVGVMGGSYGGFATAWLAARRDDYRSAVVERGLLSWISFAGTSDIGAYFDRMYVDHQLPEGLDRLWEASPLSATHAIETPTLVVHSENDFRTPIEQAEQFFMLLRRNGVATEFVRFPGEGHELSRSGKPRRRVERFDAILDWQARHLD